MVYHVNREAIIGTGCLQRGRLVGGGGWAVQDRGGYWWNRRPRTRQTPQSGGAPQLRAGFIPGGWQSRFCRQRVLPIAPPETICSPSIGVASRSEIFEGVDVSAKYISPRHVRERRIHRFRRFLFPRPAAWQQLLVRVLAC